MARGPLNGPYPLRRGWPIGTRRNLPARKLTKASAAQRRVAACVPSDFLPGRPDRLRPSACRPMAASTTDASALVKPSGAGARHWRTGGSSLRLRPDFAKVLERVTVPPDVSASASYGQAFADRLEGADTLGT
jgi:hypothetical protein